MTAEQVRALRLRLGLTQTAFAARYGIARRLLGVWESRGATTGAARGFLLVIAAEPALVADILARGPQGLPPGRPLPPRAPGRRPIRRPGPAVIADDKVVVRASGLLDASDSARYLGLNPATLRLWRRAGKGPAAQKVGGRFFYYRSDLDGFIRQQNGAL